MMEFAIKFAAVFLGALLFSWDAPAALSTDGGLLRGLEKKDSKRAYSSKEVELIKNRTRSENTLHHLRKRKKIGKTDMNQALAQGDLEGFQQALGRGLLEKTAQEFFEDWWTVDEEGNTALHQLAAMESSQEGAKPPAFYLLQIVRALSFPQGKKIKTKGKIKLGGLHLFKPLEKTGIGGAVSHFIDRETFHKEVDNLLSRPVWELWATLHSSTWSRKSLRGLISDSSPSAAKAEFYFKEIKALEHKFTMPLFEPNFEGLSPIDIAKKRGLKDNYYVLRSAVSDRGDFNRDVYMIFGAAAAWGLEANTIFASGSDTLNRLAADWGMSAVTLGDAAFAAPPALAAAGIACHHIFKSGKRKSAVKKLEGP